MSGCFRLDLDSERIWSLELRAMLSLHALVSGAKKKRARDEIARLLELVSGGEDTPDVIEGARAAKG